MFYNRYKNKSSEKGGIQMSIEERNTIIDDIIRMLQEIESINHKEKSGINPDSSVIFSNVEI